MRACVLASCKNRTGAARLSGVLRTGPVLFTEDGHQVADLPAVVAPSAAGGRSRLGATGANPYTEPRVAKGFVITADETRALVAFLRTLGGDGL